MLNYVYRHNSESISRGCILPGFEVQSCVLTLTGVYDDLLAYNKTCWPVGAGNTQQTQHNNNVFFSIMISNDNSLKRHILNIHI